MKTAIYISGITGTILLMIRLLGIFLDFRRDDIVLISGLILLVLICIPLLLVDKHLHNKKIDRIIESYKGKEKDERETKESGYSPKGWGMNDSPFRERKSGLSWGGGNMHAANASRGKRRSFLR